MAKTYQLKQLFPGSFKLDEAELKLLWDEAIFVFDANVLLNYYRYSPQAKLVMEKVFEAGGDRVWIPFQAAEEFARNRLRVIASQTSTYETAIADIRKLLETLKSPRSHPFVKESTLKRTTGALEFLENELKATLSAYETLLHDDHSLLSLAAKLDGRIGAEPNGETLESYRKRARERIDKKIPPGFLDKKSDDRELGDGVLWMQTLDYAKAADKSVILITDDAKEDWWEVVRGKTIGPRSEMVKEFLAIVGKQFYLYQPSQFLKHATEYYKIAVDSSVIEEAELVSVTRAETSNERRKLEFPTLSVSSLRKFLRTRFPDRRDSSSSEIARLMRELRAVDLQSLDEVEELLQKNWEIFLDYEQRRIEGGQSNFTSVGVVRVIKDRVFHGR